MSSIRSRPAISISKYSCASSHPIVFCLLSVLVDAGERDAASLARVACVSGSARLDFLAARRVHLVGRRGQGRGGHQQGDESESESDRAHHVFFLL
jgi:hypothetical protein